MEVPLARAERSTSSMARPIHLERRNVVSAVQLVAAVDMLIIYVTIDVLLSCVLKRYYQDAIYTIYHIIILLEAYVYTYAVQSSQYYLLKKRRQYLSVATDRFTTK